MKACFNSQCYTSDHYNRLAWNRCEHSSKNNRRTSWLMCQRAASVCILMFAWVRGSYHFLSCRCPSKFRSQAVRSRCAASPHEDESEMSTTTKPPNNTSVFRRTFPFSSAKQISSCGCVCAPTRPPLPPPLPLPNPSWISMRNFRDLAVWGMPDLHRYQTYESCRSNLCWSLLTFDWRTSSDLNTLTNAKSASTVLATLPLRHLSIEMVLGF